jgi:hypothetical protein
MTTATSSAAAWAAPLFAQLADHPPASTKQTHKLPRIICALWLPDFAAYVRSVNALTGSFETSPNAEGALRLTQDLIEAVGLELCERTGVRLHVRAYHPAH